jgi:hypothetical protein
MNARMQWVRDHDAGKLLIIGLATIPVFLLVILASDNRLFAVVALAGMACWGVGGYWLGNWKWLLIPLVAILVEIVCAIPVSLATPTAGETPVSIVLESWFWAGLPALIGAGAGYGIKRWSVGATSAPQG